MSSIQKSNKNQKKLKTKQQSKEQLTLNKIYGFMFRPKLSSDLLA